MSEFTMTVDGKAVDGRAVFDVLDPATERIVAQAPACGPDQLDAAMAAAARALPAWRGDEKARRYALRQAADALEADAGRLAALITAEQGKPLAEAHDEVVFAAVWLRYYADLDLPREVVQDDDSGYAEVVRRPLGVVAAIAPWNYPVILATWKIAPALRAGNTMVLKPSPYTPLATLVMGELLRGALPPGVLNVVSGPEPLGAHMTAHRTVRKVSFTGSTAVGKQVARAAAGDLKRVTLELGGNDPAVVLDDADPEQGADQIVANAFLNAGQVCYAVKRLYVPESRYDAWVEAVTERAAALRTGDGREDGVQLGPLSNRAQLDHVRGLVADARAHGAVPTTGARELDRPGYFYAPTVLRDVSDGAAVVDEEQFGPVLPVIAYRDVQEAVTRANATAYGLTASVWSADPDRAAKVARSLECGQVCVNAHGTGLRPDLPFGGHKCSGLGVENGPWGLYAYTQLQVLTGPPRT